MNIKHILLTTDLSEEALRPFVPVIELAEFIGCRVTVLHVVQDLPVPAYGAPFFPPMAPPDIPLETKKAREVVEEQCADLTGGVDLEIEVTSHKNLAQGIVDYAREKDVDLIALSTHGRTGFRHMAFGSVAEAVLRLSPVPVLSFPRVAPVPAAS